MQFKYFLSSKRGLVVALLSTVLLMCVLIFTDYVGQAHPRIPGDDLKVGDRVEVSVSGLEGDKYYEPCIITGILETGYEVKCNGIIFTVQSVWVRRPKANTPAPNPKPIPKDEPEPKPADTAAAESCVTISDV